MEIREICLLVCKEEDYTIFNVLNRPILSCCRSETHSHFLLWRPFGASISSSVGFPPKAPLSSLSNGIQGRMLTVAGGCGNGLQATEIQTSEAERSKMRPHQQQQRKHHECELLALKIGACLGHAARKKCLHCSEQGAHIRCDRDGFWPWSCFRVFSLLNDGECSMSSGKCCCVSTVRAHTY